MTTVIRFGLNNPTSARRRTETKQKFATLAALTMLVLSACGGGGGGTTPPGPPPPSPPPPGPVGTFISGKVLDTNSFAADGTELPVVGVSVSFLGEGDVVVTDANGEFVIDNLQAGEKVIDFNTSNATAAPSGDGYAGFREQIQIGDGANEVTRPFYLPRITSSSLTTIDPNVDTVVTNSDIGVSLTVFAGTAKDGNGDLFTGQLSISEVPDAIAPAALPEDLEPGLLFTIQPVGVTFDTPATLSIRNDRDNWVAGSQIDFWSLDPDLGVFAIVGDGVVSADGSTIETMSGGVRAADWHGPLPPSAFSGNPPNDNEFNCSSCCGPAGAAVGSAGDNNGGGPSNGGTGCSAGGPSGLAAAAGAIAGAVNASASVAGGWGSAVDFHNGRFREYISLPPYVSQNKIRNLDFAYASDRAYPVRVMTAAPIIPAAAPVPPSLSYRGVLNGVDQGYEFFLDASVLSEDQDEEFRIALPLDATELPTGSYTGTARVFSHYPRTSISGRIFHDVNIINDVQSEFGAGWRLMGLDRIYPVTSGGVLLVDGQGMARRYVEANGSGSLVTIVADAPDFTDAAVWTSILDEMGVPWQLRSTGSDFFGTTVPRVSADDIPDTALFLLVSSSGNAIFSPSDLTVEDKSAVLDVLEDAQDQGLPLLIVGQAIQPFDTGFAQNPNCCLREPELTRYEQLVKLSRFSQDNSSSASGRTWRLNDPTHPIFNGPFGNIVPVANTPFTNALAAGYSAQNVSRANAGETVLAEVFTPNNGGSLLNDHPIVVSQNGSSGARALSIAVLVTGGLPADVEAILKNSVNWLLMNITEPGELVSPLGDSTVVTLLADGTYTRRAKNGYTYSFDASGFLQTASDRNNNTMTYVYDSNGNVTTITDPVGKITTLSYSGGKLDRVTDPAGRVTSFSHDASGDLTTVTYPDASTRQFTYDARHLMSSQTNQRGFTNSYEFNHAGHAIRATQADGSVRTLVPSQSIGLLDPALSEDSSSKPSAIFRLPSQ